MASRAQDDEVKEAFREVLSPHSEHFYLKVITTVLLEGRFWRGKLIRAWTPQFARRLRNGSTFADFAEEVLNESTIVFLRRRARTGKALGFLKGIIGTKTFESAKRA